MSFSSYELIIRIIMYIYSRSHTEKTIIMGCMRRECTCSVVVRAGRGHVTLVRRWGAGRGGRGRGGGGAARGRSSSLPAVI